MDTEKNCDNCKFNEQASDITDTGTRCGNCKMLTFSGKEHYPNWEPDDDEEYNGPPIIHYI